MNKFKITCLVLSFTMLLNSCKSDNKVENEGVIQALLQERYVKLLEYPLDSLSFPRSMTPSTGFINKVPSKDWTSGFFPGNLWQLYQLTGNDAYKEKAASWTTYIEKEKYNNKTHDMGFKVFCSFGKGLEVEDNQKYKDIIVESAKTLSTRFNKIVGSIRSWDFNKDIWEFPVIIDNMLNLELLFEATKISGDSTYHKIAVQHANTTLKNHFRKDNSTFHVVVYDTLTGKVKDKVTHQGFNNESSWARGQGWAIYGYTMAYRYTKDNAYLTQAEATANFFINNINMPDDGIPYWDFNDPSIPNAPRDVSAAAVVASALLELYTITKNETYLNYSKKVINTLNSREYILNPEVSGPFILDHSTGNWPKNDEIDEPIVYGDYYYLEALLRMKSL
ncbi:glycoside hydrolase family 88 protein [Siansivirga zeaxanthinifaciens]|uniref:Glucuronyl hydrolase n=1 Tax=Siansivirga zeaxanthinifaciens CC-SAMT-1 TaxID=1454006 RepID=A0A0C5WH35_9FLAO|nr:glycoside hydrolase family 88 protein [Siansivirga zeaxanthinifaciens]AJR04464.1 glucuronyl hydrolase [Siansivirga zeaxanthinifaciens CC-SAMT-1]